MFYFLYNCFTLQYIILYCINRHITYKFGWSRNKLRERSLNYARGQGIHVGIDEMYEMDWINQKLYTQLAKESTVFFFLC